MSRLRYKEGCADRCAMTIAWNWTSRRSLMIWRPQDRDQHTRGHAERGSPRGYQDQRHRADYADRWRGAGSGGSWSIGNGAGPAPGGKPVYNFGSEGREHQRPVPDPGRWLRRVHRSAAGPEAQNKMALHAGRSSVVLHCWHLAVAPEVGEAFAMLTTAPGEDIFPKRERLRHCHSDRQPSRLTSCPFVATIFIRLEIMRKGSVERMKQLV